jgi:hypothetical protein
MESDGIHFFSVVSKKMQKPLEKTGFRGYINSSHFSGGWLRGKKSILKYSIFRRKFQYKTHGGCEKTGKIPREKGPP